MRRPKQRSAWARIAALATRLAALLALPLVPAIGAETADGKAPAVAPATPAAAAPASAVRTLEDVTIEGELRLPQVLFISSREAVRPLDALAFFGPADPRAVALATPLPGDIVVPLELETVELPRTPTQEVPR